MLRTKYGWHDIGYRDRFSLIFIDENGSKLVNDDPEMCLKRVKDK